MERCFTLKVRLRGAPHPVVMSRRLVYDLPEHVYRSKNFLDELARQREEMLASLAEFEVNEVPITRSPTQQAAEILDE